MTPEQAINVLVQASQMAAMPAQAHMQCQQAAQVLTEVIKIRSELEEQRKTIENLCEAANGTAD